MEYNFSENQNQPVAPATQKTAVGSVVGTIIIVALLAFGALYFWGDKLNNETNAGPYTLDAEFAATAQEEVWMPKSSDSDEASDIASELEAFDVGAFENQLNADLGSVDSGL